MVIMALVPKAIDRLPASPPPGDVADAAQAPSLEIETPEVLPDALAGRPYRLALSATGGQGELRWSIGGTLPEGLSFDPTRGQIEGTPLKGTPEPIQLVLRVHDESRTAVSASSLSVYQADGALTLPSRWKPSPPPVPVRAWLEQGLGFLFLWLVHLVSMNLLRSFEQSRLRNDEAGVDDPQEPSRLLRRRFFGYRWAVRLTTLGATAFLALWLWNPHDWLR
jgi:hypothetical protein